MKSTAKSTEKRRRPLGVVILAVVQLLYAVFCVLSVTDLNIEIDLRFLPDEAAPFLALFSLALAVGLWLLQRWAWNVMMLWTGLGLTADLVDYVRGDPHYVQMLVSMIVVFYLNLRSVQYAFYGRRDEDPLEVAG
jgi:hypothetical protein